MALRAEVYLLADPILRRIREVHGSIPAVGGTGWWSAPDWVRLGALLILAERWLLREDEIERAVAERLKAAAVAISAGHDWTAASRRPSHAELRRRRGDPA